MNNIQLKCCREYQVVLPIVHGSCSLAEYQAGLPGKVASLYLVILLCISSILQIFISLDLSIRLKNLGFLILKNFSHIRSNNTAKKNPTAIVDSVNNSHPLSIVINGSKTQQPAHRINLILGKYLAYVNNCSGVISHSSGILVGSLFQSLSFSLYNCRSISDPTTGYHNTIKANIAWGLEINNAVIKEKIRAIAVLGSIAINPEYAITLGSLKFINFIKSVPVLCGFWCSYCLFIAQNCLNLLPSINLSLANSKETCHAG